MVPLVLYGTIWSCIVPYCPVWSHMALHGLIWSRIVHLHEISDNYASQHEITHNRIRKLEKNKKSLDSIIYHDIAKYDTRYLMLDKMLYHKIVIDSSFNNELYPCAPIVRLVIFFSFLATFSHRRSARIKIIIERKLLRTPKILGVYPFPDSIDH